MAHATNYRANTELGYVGLTRKAYLVEDIYIYMYIYICTYIHAHIHIYIHTHINKYITANLVEEARRRQPCVHRARLRKQRRLFKPCNPRGKALGAHEFCPGAEHLSLWVDGTHEETQVTHTNTQHGLTLSPGAEHLGLGKWEWVRIASPAQAHRDGLRMG